MNNLLCLASRYNLLIDSSDEIKICCNNQTVIGNLNNPLDNVAESAVLKQIQQSLDQNRWPDSCQRCMIEENSGTRSYRIDYNSLYPEFEHETQNKIKTLHFQNDNTCNLMCVYCGPKFSSKWAAENKTFTIKKSNIPVSDNVIKNLTMVTFAGGEPSLIKPYAELAKRIINLNPSCRIIVNTNLTHFHDSDLFRLLEKHQNTILVVSFETTESRFQYIRFRADWKTFEDNFKQAVNRFSTVQTSMILFPLSISGICDAIDFAKIYLTEDNIFINDYFGNHFNWGDIGSFALAQNKESLLKYSSKLSDRLSDEIANRMKHAVSTQKSTCIQFLEDFDRKQNTSHRLIFPELYEQT
jgi:MoaA/NifB/PqqE/SkfB family radical SAM enzyme